MNYQITIVRKEPNPNFEAELSKWNEANSYRKYEPIGEYPRTEVATNALICELTEAEYLEVKKNVLGVFK